MQNREAARYARWSGGVAIAIFLLVLVVYLHRRMQQQAGAKNLRPVPATVAQQSAGFTFSKVVGTQTLFTVHASQATQFKDENRSLLENVAIEIYGARGERNDSVRADECSYEPPSGNIRCQSVVQVDLRNVKGNSAQKNVMHFETSDILFDGGSGEASTANPVAFEFPGGQGKGTGILYDPQSENVKVQKDVQLEIVPSRKNRGEPVRVSGSALEFRRSENVLRLTGPVRAQQDGRSLTAGNLELRLDGAMQPGSALATGGPQFVASGARGKASVAAKQFTADFSEGGMLNAIAADENVQGESSGKGSKNRWSAQHVELLMNRNPGASEPHEVLARGDVKLEMKRGEKQTSISTESLRMELAGEQRSGERIQSAETLAPGEIVMTGPKGTERLQGGKLNAIFGARNEIDELRGSSGVKIERAIETKPTQSSSAENLLAKFDEDGQWKEIDENGGVEFRDGERSGAADASQITRATNEMKLTGSAFVEDAASHLQADKIQINQSSNEMHGSGHVVGSFAQQQKRSGRMISPTTETVSPVNSVQISADEMSGTSPAKSSRTNSSTTSVGADGHAVFTGHARLWQGSDILQANTIEFWQQEKRTEARGKVVGAFVEAPHKEAAGSKQPAKKSAPVLWQVQSPKVDYWSDDGKMDWSGGVKAHSSEGTIESQTLEMTFSRTKNGQQTLERAIADGAVHIEQNGRTGTAERGEYFARDGKFILSGGAPALADAFGNTTTGHELTFFLANDSVLVDSQNTPSSSPRP